MYYRWKNQKRPTMFTHSPCCGGEHVVDGVPRGARHHVLALGLLTRRRTTYKK